MPVVAISVDEAEDTRQFAREHGLTFPLLRDADLAVTTAWGVAMADVDIPVPATFVVRRDRTIAWRYIGETQADFAAPAAITAALSAAISDRGP